MAKHQWQVLLCAGALLALFAPLQGCALFGGGDDEEGEECPDGKVCLPVSWAEVVKYLKDHDGGDPGAAMGLIDTKGEEDKKAIGTKELITYLKKAKKLERARDFEMDDSKLALEKEEAAAMIKLFDHESVGGDGSKKIETEEMEKIFDACDKWSQMIFGNEKSEMEKVDPEDSKTAKKAIKAGWKSFTGGKKKVMEKGADAAAVKAFVGDDEGGSRILSDEDAQQLINVACTQPPEKPTKKKLPTLSHDDFAALYLEMNQEGGGGGEEEAAEKGKGDGKEPKPDQEDGTNNGGGQSDNGDNGGGQSDNNDNGGSATFAEIASSSSTHAKHPDWDDRPRRWTRGIHGKAEDVRLQVD